MPAQIVEFLDIYANLLILAVIGYYLFWFRGKEKELQKREAKIDTEYHHIVDEALAKERKILDDATQEADQIIKGAKYLSEASQAVLEQALQKMVADVHNQAATAARNYTHNYQNTLHQLATSSLTDFQGIAKALATELEKESQTFRATAIPALQKELEEYKKMRYQQTEQDISRIVQHVAQELLNKTISMDDHHTLLMQSLDKAKKAGVFE